MFLEPNAFAKVSVCCISKWNGECEAACERGIQTGQLRYITAPSIECCSPVCYPSNHARMRSVTFSERPVRQFICAGLRSKIYADMRGTLNDASFVSCNGWQSRGNGDHNGSQISRGRLNRTNVYGSFLNCKRSAPRAGIPIRVIDFAPHVCLLRTTELRASLTVSRTTDVCLKRIVRSSKVEGTQKTLIFVLGRSLDPSGGKICNKTRAGMRYRRGNLT